MRLGNRRPASQLNKCEAGAPIQWFCKYRRRQEDIQGRYRARMWEANYFANYVRVMGRCPPGAPKCI